ncbi:hypothetical protein IV203_028636 [Nitzschia inconspicua]|uniref:Uncharacterized protein n=1 Tax=Nitzschia inconspicua TaxID=303405 RepID=A0A9K3Q033_9STRA|nr:hypothetical protein IV203_004715 [Nitzschia inconspicua]KAG7365966.1 hypothetical protein IV203_028636 [Nitzschia inconspicua]
MGLQTPVTPSSAGLPGTTGKRSCSGSPTMAISHSFPHSRRIPRSTLHKLFVGMMTTAFLLYAVFTAYLIRHHHTTIIDFGVGGKWGPNALAGSNEKILKAHIRKLRELQQLKSPQDKILFQVDSLLVDTQQKSKVEAASGNNHSPKRVNDNGKSTSKHETLMFEEVDIHDMKHPKEIQKEPREGQ